MKTFALAVIATLAIGIAATSPAAAQRDPYQQGNPNDRYQGDANRRDDQGPDRRDNSWGDRRDSGRDQTWNNRDRGDQRDVRDQRDGRRNWRSHRRQVCNIVWRHHHRQRVCYNR